MTAALDIVFTGSIVYFLTKFALYVGIVYKITKEKERKISSNDLQNDFFLQNYKNSNGFNDL